MKVTKLNYNRIARTYDFLSRIVFWGAQQKIQKGLIKWLKNGDNILIVGGGSGWILEEIAKLNLAKIKITYVEESSKMIQLTRRRQFQTSHVEIIQADIFELKIREKFDVIFTPFLFDHFNKEESQYLFEKLNKCANKSALWINTDFSLNSGAGKWWKKIYMAIIYIFFKWAIHIKNSELTELDPIIIKKGYSKLFEKYTYMNFIHGSIWQKE
ncbi:MAG: class I SAM-dependent methyltransferase [Saprospiraceae bacterium]|nr:class I SAM-dependent methyltransferase [Saprospiraceae bacterium]